MSLVDAKARTLAIGFRYGHAPLFAGNSEDEVFMSLISFLRKYLLTITMCMLISI